MKVQLKSPVFEVSEEEFKSINDGVCPFDVCPSCPESLRVLCNGPIKHIGYTLEAMKEE